MPHEGQQDKLNYMGSEINQKYNQKLLGFNLKQLKRRLNWPSQLVVARATCPCPDIWGICQ